MVWKRGLIMLRLFRKKLVWIPLILLVLLGLLALLVFQGVLPLNRPSKADYPIRGVDVSSYQGEIDWPLLASQGIQFAYIKATEGSSFVDAQYENNMENALKTDLKVGAYHFFSYDSSGATQGAHFIKTVTQEEGMLPPVIDVEFYGDKERNLPDAASAKQKLSAMVGLLTAHYQTPPVLYATEKSYRLYIARDFPDCEIWIRNVVTEPTLSDGRSWTFWQYSNRIRLDGYNGEESFIDMNIFQGSASDFAAFCS